MTALDAQLAALLRWAPPDSGWSIPEVFSERVEISDCVLHSVGLSAVHERGELVYGSAAERETTPLARAYFELIERAATLDALCAPAGEYDVRDAAGRVVGLASQDVVFPAAPPTTSWRYARSNGIAAHTNWGEACAAARLELCERDRVLRSWFGGAPPRVQPLPPGIVPNGLLSLYEAVAFSLPAGDRARCAVEPTVVAGLVLFPRDTANPLAYGFAARLTLHRAIEAAARECLQALAFLWGEPLPDCLPRAHSDPGFHQEHYLHPSQHESLRAWLCGAHAVPGNPFFTEPEPGRFGFIDLTPTSLRGRVYVAKALPAGELPLTFGLGHPNVPGRIPDSMRVHPIP